MTTINLREKRQAIDYMARDYDSFRQSLIDLIPAKMPEWTDRSEANFGIALIELFAYMADILSHYQDRVANEAFLSTAQERRSVIEHLRLIGYEMQPAAPATARLSAIVANNVNGTVEVRKGDQFATPPAKGRKSLTFEYTADKPLLIDFSAATPNSATNPDGTELTGFKEVKDVIPVREGKSITNEVIGVSDGTPNQRFRLAQPQLIRGTLEVIVETPVPTPPWRLRSSLIFGRRAFTPEELAVLEHQERIGSTLAFSRGLDTDYTIETDQDEFTTVIFGDGQYGQIPETGTRIVASYRVGGGTAGNVAAGQIKGIAKAPQLQLLGVKVVNRDPSSGGAERETVEQAIKFAPSVFTSMQRAVTADDYVAQAKLFPGVSKARAEVTNWNTIKLFVAPTGSGEVPSDTLTADLLAYFEDKRMLTSLVEIGSPDYVQIEIRAEIGVVPFFTKEKVQADAEQAVRELLAFEEVDFKQILYLSKVYEALEGIDGVDFVFVHKFRRSTDIEDIPSDGRIVMQANEIPVLEPEDLLIESKGGRVAVQVSNLKAEPDPRGGRIILSWINPSDAGFAGVKILRRETAHPVIADIGTAVEIRDVSAATSPAGTTVRLEDAGLKPETVFYYAVVAYEAGPVFSSPALASAMSTAPYQTALHLYNSLPAVYRNFDSAVPPDVPELEPQDRARGQLSRFVDMFGLQFDLMRSFASGTLDFHAVPRVEGTLLPLLSSWVGWQHNSALDHDKQRNEIKYSPHFYRTTGIAANLRATINRLVTWDAHIKEFVHSVFLSTHPEQLTISERQHRDGAFQPPQVATLDVAYEGRPAPLRTADNRDWLFYHARQSAPLAAPPTASSEAIRAKSSSKDLFHIWFKIHEQDEWESSRRVTDGDGVNKHPTAIEDGDGRIWLFWTSYSTDAEPGPAQLRLALVSGGRSQRPARVRSTNRAPFTFADGDRFRVVVVDGADSFTRVVTFHTEHFSNIANATAEETASLLDSEIPGVDVTADEDGSIVLTSHATGAGAELQFPASPVATEVGFAGSATGTNATAAQIAGSRPEPFALADGDSLSIKIDGRRPRIITFRTTDFVDITQATAAEVVAAINRVVPGVASVAANRVNLTSTSSGGASTLVAEVFAPLLFSLPNTFVATLDAATLSPALRDALDAGGLKLLPDATIRVATAGSVWLVMNAGRAFQIRNEGGPLNVYGRALGEAALGFGAALPASTPVADDCEPSAFREAGNVWLFWSSRRNGRWKIWYNRCPLAAPVWGTAKILTTGTESDREPSAMFVAAGGGRIWVFWSRKKANGLWNIFVRATTNLDFNALADADWDEEELTPVPADYDNREPACILQPPDGTELFFTSNRNDGWHLWTKGITPAGQGADTRLTTGQFTHRAPAAVRISDQLRKLFFRTNESQTYTSQVFPAAQTVDERYSGSTALDTRNAAKIGQRKNFQDSQRYTYDTLKGEDNWYARDTVGIYLTPDTIDQALVVRRRNQIEGVLREFLPIQVRTVFVIDQVIVEFFYTYDDPTAVVPSLIGEQMIDTILGEVFPAIADELIGDTADFLWLHTFDAEHVGAVLPDLGVVPPDLTFRLPLSGVGEGEPGE